MANSYWFRVPHKRHCHYQICVNGAIMRVSKEQYHNMEKIMQE